MNGIARVASSTKGVWVNWVVCSKSGRSWPLMRPFWSFLESRAKFLRSKVHFLDLQVCCDWSTFFPLVSADVCWGGLRDEPVINWQLSKQVVRWPVSHDRIAGSSVSYWGNVCFWSYPLTSYLFFNWSQDQLQVDFFAMVTSLLFELNYKFIYGSFALSKSLYYY